MIRIDSYDEDASGADWFCYHSCSPCIFPIGFCSQHGLPLTPPKGYDPTTFTWDAYLTETNTIPAPVQLFNRVITETILIIKNKFFLIRFLHKYI